MTMESTKINSEKQVLILNLPPNPNVSNVDAIARERLSPPLSPTSAQLRSDEATKPQILMKRYKAASQLIDSDPEQARTLFLELIRDIPKNEASLIFLADCKLRLADTHPEDSQERNEAALNAKVDIDRVYQNRNAWDSLGEEEKISRYIHLRTCLKGFEKLVQHDMSSLDNNVESQIEECNRNIPLLTDFYDKLNEGVLFQEKEAKREVYTQALAMIVDHEEPGYLLARAFGWMHLALTHRTDDDNPFSLRALDQATIAYQQKVALFTSDQAKLNALKLFDGLFHNLIQLFPEDSEHLVAINKMLEECRQEIALLEGSIPENENGTKVTKEPVDHWKTVRLVIAFGFAVAVITGAFVLGRRYITRLN